YAWQKGWVPANKLEVGDTLLTEDGRWVAVEDVLDTGEWETVYNLRVADYHTYFVGCDEWGFSVWAHHAQYGDLPDPTEPTHTLFRNMLNKHGYKEIKGKIFKHGKEIDQAHIEELTRLYQQ